VNRAAAHVVTSVVRFAARAGGFVAPAGTSADPTTITLTATVYQPLIAGSEAGGSDRALARAGSADGAASSDARAGHALPGLIVGHGAGSRRLHHDRFARTACLAGMVVLALDFRGHGDSDGVLDGPAEHDLVAAAAFLRGLDDVDPRRISYRGSSLGGYYGLQAAGPAGFSSMVLVCPATEAVMLGALDGGFDEDRARERGLDLRADADALRAYFAEHDVMTTAAAIDCDVLLVHARGDTVVPLASSLELAAHLAGRTDVVILPGGDHSSAQGSEAIDRLTVRWLFENGLRLTRPA
jgi:pimeloyl-ACP methyl ester carboxylesterase